MTHIAVANINMIFVDTLLSFSGIPYIHCIAWKCPAYTLHLNSATRQYKGVSPLMAGAASVPDFDKMKMVRWRGWKAGAYITLEQQLQDSDNGKINIIHSRNSAAPVKLSW